MAGNVIIRGGEYEEDERSAAAAITPGEAVVIDANGDFAAAAAGNTNVAIARLDVMNPDRDVDTDYAANDPVQGAWLWRGATFQARVAGGQNIAVGDDLVAGAGGTFIEQTTEPDTAVVAVAEEAATDAANFRVDARWVK